MNQCNHTFKSLLRGQVSEKSTFFKELTPRLRTYELRGQRGKKNTPSQRQTNTSHCPTKTISKTDTRPLNGRFHTIIYYLQRKSENLPG